MRASRYFSVAPNSKSSLIAQFIHCDAPDLVGTAVSIGSPVIEPVKALGAEVPGKYPQHGRFESQINKMSASCRYQRNADAASPVIGFDVKSVEFAEARDVRVASWSRGSEAMNHASLGSHDGVGIERVWASEGVFLRPIFRAQLIEIVVGENVAVSGLPGAHMDARDCQCISRIGRAKQHG